MNKIESFFELKKSQFDIKYFILMVFLAFVFSISVRYIWVDTFSGVEAFKWNNELMINTNDGYYYAEGARDIINGTHQENDLSPIKTPLAKLTAFLVSILPFSFESIILWMPAFFSSLLVIPIMIVMRTFNQDSLGFYAALLASISWSYYNRTMTGYYDTDMLIVVLPTFMVAGLIVALNSQSTKYLIIAPLFAVLSLSWHGGTEHIANGTLIMTLLYTFLYHRFNLFYYKQISLFIISLSSLSLILKVVIIILLSLFFYSSKNSLNKNKVIIITIVSTLLYLIFGGGTWLLNIINNVYITRLFALDINSFHYFSVLNTVRETGSIPFEVFANRVSGSEVSFILACIGYILLIYKYRIMILTIPMVILGFFAFKGGLRFTVFAIPFMSLGAIYIVFIISKNISFLVNEKAQKKVNFLLTFILSMLIIYPNIKHAEEYKISTVFLKDEVSVLEKLSNIASREDYVLSWWDYGYPIRYYSDVKTLVDGGKHSGKDNFLVSFSLLKRQVESANMARFNVEFTEKNYKEKCGGSLRCILEAYKIKDPNYFLNTLNKKNIQRPKKTREVFYYLPSKMLNILPTVDMFSNIDIVSGKKYRKPFYYLSKNFKDNGQVISLGNNVNLDKKNATLKFGKNEVKLNYFILTEYSTDGVFKKKVHKISDKSGVSVIYMKSYKQFLILDSRLLNSTYIQLFVLENYDKDLFEPIILTPLTKVYKLKI